MTKEESLLDLLIQQTSDHIGHIISVAPYKGGQADFRDQSDIFVEASKRNPDKVITFLEQKINEFSFTDFIKAFGNVLERVKKENTPDKLVERLREAAGVQTQAPVQEGTVNKEQQPQQEKV